ncbi:4557_t:CDS:2, partial [Entrophospora sp. SA101]
MLASLDLLGAHVSMLDGNLGCSSHLRNRTTSYVAFTENERLIGDAAKDQAAMNPKKYYAGRIAALDVLRIINEPTAYGLDSKDISGKNILIFDFGGRIFDISLSNMFGYIFAVKATAGETHLDSEDFDNNLLEYFKQEFKRMMYLVMLGYPTNSYKSEIQSIKLSIIHETIEPVRKVLKGDCFAVAYGAAVQTALLTNQANSDKTQDLLLLNMVPLSLGVETQGGIMTIVVPLKDPCVVIIFLDHLNSPMPHDEAKLERTFDINGDGILKVTAKDKATGPTEIKHMIAESKKLKEEDKQSQERVEAKQELENYVYQIENTLNKPNVALELKRNNKAGECTSSYQTLHPYHAHFPGGQLTPIGTAWYLFKTEED